MENWQHILYHVLSSIKEYSIAFTVLYSKDIRIMLMQYLGRQFHDEDYTQRSFPGGEFEDCVFSECIMANIDLSGCRFISCTFNNCDLSLTLINNVSFQKVRFFDCKMLGIRFDECDDFLLAIDFDTCMLNLSSFYALPLKGTKFLDCKMREVELVQTDLTGATFSKCDLSDAAFGQTILNGADLRSAYGFRIDPDVNKLSGAQFSTQNIAGLLDKYNIIIEP